ncbi:MAG: hypothetical protein FWH18_05260 [Marinilabiliaceae bacterium]|nr:hypothetical protein [Marinilabiliaceae bacterium]
MKKYLLLILFYCISQIGVACNISSSIFVNIERNDKRSNESLFFIRTTIEQHVQLQNIKSDSLTLVLENFHPLGAIIPAYTFPQLQVFEKISQNADYQKINFSFDGTTIIFPTSNENFNIKIVYENYALSFAQHVEAFYLFDYRYDSESWFFTHPNMQIQAVNISVSDDFYFFSNLPETIHNNTFQLNTEVLSDNNISFVVLLKEYYEKMSFSNELNKFDIYFSKEYGISEDSTRFLPIDKSIYWMEENLQTIKTAAIKINKFIPDISRNICIIDGELNTEGMAWGMSISPVAKKDYLILIDVSFWKNKTIVHEMLHCYFPFVPQKEDSAFYLLGESMIEFLAISLSNDTKKAEKIFKENLKNSKRKGYGKVSIFDITDNRMDATTQKGSSVVIYQKTPALIHKFAKKNGGVDKFLGSLSIFYQQVQATEKISFQEFENVLKFQGISGKQWDRFVKKL